MYYSGEGVLQDYKQTAFIFYSPYKIIRRNGSVITFISNQIPTALTKACITGMSLHDFYYIVFV